MCESTAFNWLLNYIRANYFLDYNASLPKQKSGMSTEVYIDGEITYTIELFREVPVTIVRRENGKSLRFNIGDEKATWSVKVEIHD